MFWRISVRERLLATAAFLSLVAFSAAQSQAADATWVGGVSGSVDNASNWSTVAAPTGAGSIATFGVSAQTALTTNGNPWGTWLFDVGASGYTFSVGGITQFAGSGIVINGGSLAINATAGLQFSNSASAGAATITSNTAIDFLNLSSAGSATINYNGGTSTFQNSSKGGTAQLNVGNAAGLNFQGTSTAENATISNSGAVQFQGNSTGGRAAITNIGSATTDFSQSSGPLGNNKLSAGSIAGSGTFSLGANELTVGNLNTSTTVSGVIADGGAGGGVGGSLVKTGNGTMILSGTNTYTGATSVTGGRLEVDGSIAASSGVTVETGGILQGIGTVKNATINAGGGLRSGDGTATTNMIMTGNLAFQSGALYYVQLNPTAASTTNVTGTTKLGGATVNATFANGSYVAKQYTILNAAGGFADATRFAPTVTNTNLPTGFKTDLSYDATHAYLNLTLAFIAPRGGFGANQTAVGNSIVNYFNVHNGIPIVYSSLTSSGLSQAAGEPATGAQQTSLGAMNSFMGTMFDQGTASGSPSAPSAGAFSFASDQNRSGNARDAYAAVQGRVAPAASFASRWNVWASGFGGSQTTDGNAATGSATTTSRIAGTSVGASYWISPNIVTGFAMAGGGTDFATGSLGSGRTDMAQGGAFVKFNAGPSYLTTAMAYGWQHVTTDRTVTIAGIDRLHAAFNTNTMSGRIEGGHRFSENWTQGVGITPYAAAQVTAISLPSYAEQVLSGAKTFALAYASRDVTNTRAELGLRADKAFALADGVLTLRGRAAWAHDSNPDRAATATFQSLPGASFVVNGAAQAPNSALATLSADMNWMNGWTATATFDSEFSNVTRSYSGKGAVRYAW